MLKFKLRHRWSWCWCFEGSRWIANNGDYTEHVCVCVWVCVPGKDMPRMCPPSCLSVAPFEVKFLSWQSIAIAAAARATAKRWQRPRRRISWQRAPSSLSDCQLASSCLPRRRGVAAWHTHRERQGGRAAINSRLVISSLQQQDDDIGVASRERPKTVFDYQLNTVSQAGWLAGWLCILACQKNTLHVSPN